MPFTQEQVERRGHAIEFRLTAEDPAQEFRPQAGEITTFRSPSGPWVRFDSHLYAGYEVPPYYDSLLAKLIVWGNTREEAIARSRAALREVDHLVNHGMTAEQFEERRQFLKKYVLHYAATTGERLGYAIDDAFYGLSEPHLVQFRRLMDELTLAEVNAALDPDRLPVGLGFAERLHAVGVVVGEILLGDRAALVRHILLRWKPEAIRSASVRLGKRSPANCSTRKRS